MKFIVLSYFSTAFQFYSRSCDRNSINSRYQQCFVWFEVDQAFSVVLFQCMLIAIVDNVDNNNSEKHFLQISQGKPQK